MFSHTESPSLVSSTILLLQRSQEKEERRCNGEKEWIVLNYLLGCWLLTRNFCTMFDWCKYCKLENLSVGEKYPNQIKCMKIFQMNFTIVHDQDIKDVLLYDFFWSCFEMKTLRVAKFFKFTAKISRFWFRYQRVQ